MFKKTLENQKVPQNKIIPLAKKILNEKDSSPDHKQENYHLQELK